MKNTLKIKLILNLMLLFSFSTCLLSQWAINPKANTADEVYFYINEDCEYIACFNTFIYNPSGEESFPPMHIRIIINEVDEIFPLTDWTYCGDDGNEESSDDFVEGIYKSTVCVNIGFIDECLITFSSDDNPNPLDPDSEVFIPYTLHLLKMINDGGIDGLGDGIGNVSNYIPYPVCQYTSPGSLFSCEIFKLTEDFCDLNLLAVPCENSVASVYSSELKLQCERCILANQPLDGGKNTKGSKRSFDSSEIILSPNPFTDNLSISNLNSSESKTILFINNLGQIVKSVNTNEPQLSISTNDLNKGIYYIMIQEGDSLETFKILKQ